MKHECICLIIDGSGVVNFQLIRSFLKNARAFDAFANLMKQTEENRQKNAVR